MRWSTGWAALACAVMLACGSRGDGGEEAGPDPGGTRGGDRGAPAGDPGACPPVGEIEDLTGEEFGVADMTSYAQGEYDLACIYETEDVGIRLLANCADYPTVDEARAALSEWASGSETRDYPVGEEAVVWDSSALEDVGVGVPILGETAAVRTGSALCVVQYQVQQPDSTEPPDGVEDALRYLARTAAG